MRTWLCCLFLPLLFWPQPCFLQSIDRNTLETSKGSGFLKSPTSSPGHLPTPWELALSCGAVLLCGPRPWHRHLGRAEPPHMPLITAQCEGGGSTSLQPPGAQRRGADGGEATPLTSPPRNLCLPPPKAGCHSLHPTSRMQAAKSSCPRPGQAARWSALWEARGWWVASFLHGWAVLSHLGAWLHPTFDGTPH